MTDFKLVSDFSPSGDQPQAIEKLVDGLLSGKRRQTLLGVTGSGKTFTIANVVARVNRPTLVISHNKTLAAQLFREFKEFFPENAVEYFISYYDYYQPEAYVPSTDTYIEKDASINDEIDRLRLSATSSLLSRRDCLIVASVSCIYGLGSPEDYEGMIVAVAKGQRVDRKEILRKLVDIQYQRNDVDFQRGRFRVRGDTIEVFPAYREAAVRIEMFGDEVERITGIDPLTGNRIAELEKTWIYPAKHFVTTESKIELAIASIERELEEHLKFLNSRNKLLEAQRLESRTRYDIEMLREIGYCSGIENYSRHIGGRAPGSRPYCLLDYFPEGFLTIIDESHVSVPQIRGMYAGDRSRKETLVEYGFRLPSCLDNRPLRFEEFEKMVGQIIFVSATPAEYELQASGKPVEQLIRPTGITEPEITVRSSAGQIDDLIAEIRKRAQRRERVLVTTLTKRMSEDLCDYLGQMGLQVRYLHSEIDTFRRVEILRDLRTGKFDCLIGINLLREGLDLPEVSLVAILDADKEGFLRSQTSLIQTAGRAARNVNSEIIMYADQVTDSMRRALEETARRRQAQIEYNRDHGITPRSIQKAVRDYLELSEEARRLIEAVVKEPTGEYDTRSLISELEQEMQLAARNLQFERAAILRDQIRELRSTLSP